MQKSAVWSSFDPIEREREREKGRERERAAAATDFPEKITLDLPYGILHAADVNVRPCTFFFPPFFFFPVVAAGPGRGRGREEDI